jgi:hypothetical protein
MFGRTDTERSGEQAANISRSSSTPTRPGTSKALPTPSHPAAVSPSSTNQGTGRELADWLAEADRIHALHHHRQAAEYHEREAQWNGQWAAWHRMEAERLAGEG